MPDTCPASKLVRETRRWCDLPPGHDGGHESHDSQGRAEYAWRREALPTEIRGIPWQTRQTHG
jgi:hypothetical protein